MAQVETLNNIVKKLSEIVTGGVDQDESLKINYKSHSVKEIDLKRKENLKQKNNQKQLTHGKNTVLKERKNKEINPEEVIPFEEDEEFKNID